MWLYSDGSQLTKCYCNCYTMAKRAGGLQSTNRLLLWAELSFSVTFPGCGCRLHSQSLKTELGNTVELQLQGGKKKIKKKTKTLGAMFSISTFNSKRKMSLEHGADQVCLSHCQVFFPGLASVEQLSELKQTHSPQWVPRFFWHLGATFLVFSTVLFPHCRFTPCHFSHSSALPHAVTGSLTLSKY